MPRTSRPKGTQDFLPPESTKKSRIETIFRELATVYGYQEVVTPTFEHTELFIKSSGTASDIVQKEMYTFTDRGGRSLTLKPEGTPGAVRAVLENNLHLPCRLFYISPCFRYSRPQKGRYREFYQLGVEALGEASPLVDAETIAFGATFFTRLGITDFTIKVNSIGCRTCRPAYREKLLNFLRENRGKMCPDCQTRMEINPLRTFDCKNEPCQQVLTSAPLPSSHLCPECHAHFQEVISSLKNSPFNWELDPHLVRGLDYYNRTTFEYVSSALGAQSSLGGGGRYDYLFEEFGGPPAPAVGLAIGLERTLLTIPASSPVFPPERRNLVFIVWTGPGEMANARELLATLRQQNIPALMTYEPVRLKRQFHLADLAGARLCLIVGEDEVRENTYGLKNLITGEQTTVPAANLIPAILALFNSPAE